MKLCMFVAIFYDVITPPQKKKSSNKNLNLSEVSD